MIVVVVVVVHTSTPLSKEPKPKLTTHPAPGLNGIKRPYPKEQNKVKTQDISPKRC